MAVFDKRTPMRVDLDDTEALAVSIENAQTVNGHTEYVIKIQRGPHPEKYWLVYKRYSDFVTLHNVIQGSGINILLPPKKFIGNMDKNFISQRQMELQNYLDAILMNHMLALSLTVRKFLDPQSYETPLHEVALQHVSMTLRSELNYEFIKPIAELGWRLRKQYFLVKSKLKPKTELLLQWVEFGPDKYFENKELQTVLLCLVNLNHPHVEKLEYTNCSDGSCCTVRQFHQCGTLRDLIYGTKPKSPFLKKYGNPKHSKPLNLNEVSLYGRQIIETLIFLHQKGIPFGHLHLGNILVLNNNIKLLDIENTILGLPSYYRPFIVQHKRINTMEAIDVYSLGHVLFEMAFGYPLKNSVCDNIPPTCPSLLSLLLESILSTESCKTGLPSLQELLQHPFFDVSNANNSEKINFKLSSNLKHSLKVAIKYIEKRLQEDQRAIRHQKKMAKVKELLISEDVSGSKQIQEVKNPVTKQLKASNVSLNGRKSPRSDSLTSISTSASAGATTPPLSAPKNSSSPLTTSSTPVTSSSTPDGRSALLDSICSFDKSLLRHKSTTPLSDS